MEWVVVEKVDLFGLYSIVTVMRFDKMGCCDVFPTHCTYTFVCTGVEFAENVRRGCGSAWSMYTLDLIMCLPVSWAALGRRAWNTHTASPTLKLFRTILPVRLSLYTCIGCFNAKLW